MAITFFGQAVSPADAGTNSTTPLAVTPPTSMLDGDFVSLYAVARNTNKSLAISETGGQTWTSETEFDGTGANLSSRVFWCRFNGTWSANPSVAYASATPTVLFTVFMGVFRPTTGSNTWAEDVAGAGANIAAASPHTITGITRQTVGALALGFWAIEDDNALATLSGTGWTRLGASADGYQNAAPNGMAVEGAYSIGDGATNDVSITDNGPDAGVTWIQAWKEVTSAVTAKASQSIVRSMGGWG